jgi:signal transduction histidine kinase
MNLIRAVIIAGILSFSLTTSVRLIGKKSAERSFAQIAADACEVLIPQAQVGGSSKNVFEEAQSVLRRHLPESQFAVEITENGNLVYARPDGSTWYDVSCPIPGRADVAIKFALKSFAIFDWSFVNTIGVNTIWLLFLGLFLEWAAKSFLKVIQERAVQELSSSLGFQSSVTSKSILTRIIRGLVASPSVKENLRGRIEALKGQIANHEKKNMELISSKIEREHQLRSTNDFLEVVRQIQHDIRGPIQTLAGMIEMSSVDEKDRQILTALFNKIQGMLKRLTVQEQVANESREGIRDHVLEAMIKEVIQEKRIAVKDFEIEVGFDFNRSALSVVRVDSLQFCRVISNLLQNAIEALPGSGRITTSIRRHQKSVFVMIEDTGRGIPRDRLALLFNKHATFDKPRGSGLGLYHAKSCLERWGGDISIDSTVGAGTTVMIQIPISLTTAKVVGEIDRNDALVNIVVDDDVEVFAMLEPQIGSKSLYFPTPEEFLSWRQEMDPSTHLRYIFDYHLGKSQSGIDLIAELSRPSDAILITNDYDHPEVIQTSSQTGFRILPKTFLQAI